MKGKVTMNSEGLENTDEVIELPRKKDLERIIQDDEGNEYPAKEKAVSKEVEKAVRERVENIKYPYERGTDYDEQQLDYLYRLASQTLSEILKEETVELPNEWVEDAGYSEHVNFFAIHERTGLPYALVQGRDYITLKIPHEDELGKKIIETLSDKIRDHEGENDVHVPIWVNEGTYALHKGPDEDLSLLIDGSSDYWGRIFVHDILEAPEGVDFAVWGGSRS